MKSWTLPPSKLAFLKFFFAFFSHLTDIDECHQGTADCDKKLAECNNTIGSYRCMCHHGYSGNGSEGSCKGIFRGPVVLL